MNNFDALTEDQLRDMGEQLLHVTTLPGWTTILDTIERRVALSEAALLNSKSDDPNTSHRLLITASTMRNFFHHWQLDVTRLIENYQNAKDRIDPQEQ